MKYFDLIVIGAGPAGIALTAEARNAGVPSDRILVLEKAEAHSFTIRKYYPENKPVLANYKGIVARCEGVLSIPDLSREDTISYLDQAIQEAGVEVRYREEVFRIKKKDDGNFLVETNKDQYDAHVVVIAIGILGRPNKPSYPVPKEVQKQTSFDVTSEAMTGLDILVAGGGDTAMEYVQYLVQEKNRVQLSFRGRELVRPNPINRDSVLHLERFGKIRIFWGSNITRLEPRAGRILVHFAEPEHSPTEVDRIVYALGGTTPENFLKTAGIDFDGPIPKLLDGFATNVPGLFLTGDLTAGKKGGSIMLAFNSSATAMRRICNDFGICYRVPPKSPETGTAGG